VRQEGTWHPRKTLSIGINARWQQSGMRPLTVAHSAPFLAPHQAKRHGKTKEYLLAMAECGLQLDLKASATAMRAFIESKKYDDVLWVFESLPSWGAARDEGHAALLIQVRFVSTLLQAG